MGSELLALELVWDMMVYGMWIIATVSTSMTIMLMACESTTHCDCNHTPVICAGDTYNDCSED